MGQGDSILIQFASKNILIDGGEADMGPRIVSYPKDHGVSGLDLVVATHPHSDHIGGLITVLKAIPVKQVLDRGQTYIAQTYQNFLTIIDQKNISFKVAERSQKINLDPRLKTYICCYTVTLRDYDIRKSLSFNHCLRGNTLVCSRIPVPHPYIR